MLRPTHPPFSTLPPSMQTSRAPNPREPCFHCTWLSPAPWRRPPAYLLGVPRHAPGHQVVNNAENQVQIFFTWGRLRCSRSSSPCSARKWPLSPHSPSSPGSPESECPKHFDPHTLTHPKSLGDGEALDTDDVTCLARGRPLKQIRFEICSKTTVFI